MYDIERLFIFIIFILSAIYTNQLRSKNVELNIAIKKLNKSNNNCLNDKNKFHDKGELINKKFEAITTVYTITTSTIYHLTNCYITNKCDFNLTFMEKVNKLNEMFETKNYNTLIRLYEAYELNKSDIIPYEILENLYKEF